MTERPELDTQVALAVMSQHRDRFQEPPNVLQTADGAASQFWRPEEQGQGPEGQGQGLPS